MPVVIGKEIPTGQSPEARVQLAEHSDCIGAEAVKIVRGHERDRPNMERTAAGTHNLQPSVIAVRPCRKFQREFCILRMQSWDRDLLPVLSTSAPHEVNFHFCCR